MCPHSEFEKYVFYIYRGSESSSPSTPWTKGLPVECCCCCNCFLTIPQLFQSSVAPLLTFFFVSHLIECRSKRIRNSSWFIFAQHHMMCGIMVVLKELLCLHLLMINLLFLSGHGLFQCIYHSEIDFCSFLHCHKRPGTSLEFPFPFYIVIRQPLSFEPFFSLSQEKRKSEREGRGGQRKISSLRWAWPHLCVAGLFLWAAKRSLTFYQMEAHSCVLLE